MNDMLWGYLNPGPQPPPNTARTLPQQGGIESGSTPSVPKAEKSSLSLTTYSNSAAGDFESQSQSTLRSVVSESKQEASPFEEIFTKARVTLNGKNTKVEYKHRRMPHKTSGLFLKSGRFNKNNLQNTILKMYYFDYEYRVPQPQWSVVLRQNKLSEKEFHELFKLFFEEEMDRFQSLADQIESPRSRKRRR
uniref:Uncharacterized protein n=1 Tax=Lotharella oceanica TaxID=641309 RepID=A0A7S2XE82_9EUKA